MPSAVSMPTAHRIAVSITGRATAIAISRRRARNRGREVLMRWPLRPLLSAYDPEGPRPRDGGRPERHEPEREHARNGRTSSDPHSREAGHKRGLDGAEGPGRRTHRRHGRATEVHDDDL